MRLAVWVLLGNEGRLTLATSLSDGYAGVCFPVDEVLDVFVTGVMPAGIAEVAMALTFEQRERLRDLAEGAAGFVTAEDEAAVAASGIGLEGFQAATTQHAVQRATAARMRMRDELRTLAASRGSAAIRPRTNTGVARHRGCHQRRFSRPRRARPSARAGVGRAGPDDPGEPGEPAPPARDLRGVA